MNQVSEFKRINGDDNYTFPLYVATNVTYNNVINKRCCICITMYIICFVIATIELYNFFKTKRLMGLFGDDDCNWYDELMYMEDCVYKNK